MMTTILEAILELGGNNLWDYVVRVVVAVAAIAAVFVVVLAALVFPWYLRWFLRPSLS